MKTLKINCDTYEMHDGTKYYAAFKEEDFSGEYVPADEYEASQDALRDNMQSRSKADTRLLKAIWLLIKITENCGYNSKFDAIEMSSGVDAAREFLADIKKQADNHLKVLFDPFAV